MRLARVLIVVSAMVGALAFAQVNSIPGHGDEPHYNQAHTWLWIDSPIPTQVSFQIPQAQIFLDLRHVVPKNPLDIYVRVYNTSDRAIIVSDDGFDSGLEALGFSSISVTPVTLAPGQAGWLIYQITMPSADDINYLIQNKESMTVSHGGGGYDPSTNTFRIVTKIIATGVSPEGDTTAEFPF